MDNPGPVAIDEVTTARPVFISYASADRKAGLSICTEIERYGEPCWISSRDVGPGENYQEAIVRAIRDARAVVLVFSRAANVSNEIKKELSLASRYRVPVIALRIEDIEPTDAFAYELSTRQWIDAFPSRKAAVEKFVRQLGDARGSYPSAEVHSGSLRFSRRTAVLAGGAAIASAGALGWIAMRRDQLPPEAQRLLEEGQAALDEGTVDQFSTAIARFKRAAEIAPDKAEPWGGLALAYERLAALSPAAQQRDLQARGDEARRRALSVDPQNGDALAAGVWKLRLYQNWLANGRACRSALEKQPRHVALNFLMAINLAQVGRMREALAHVDRAGEINPKFVAAYVVRVILLRDNGRPDEADSVAEAAHRSWPRNYAIWFTRLYQLAYGGRAPEALAMIDDQGGRPIGIPDWNFAVTRLQVQALGSRAAGDIDAAVKASLDAAHHGAGFAEGAIMIAGTFGRVDDAYRAIDGYFFDRGFRLPETRFSQEQGTYNAPKNRFTYMLFSPFTRSLRDDHRFGRLTSELGLDDYWRQSGTKPDYLV